MFTGLAVAFALSISLGGPPRHPPASNPCPKHYHIVGWTNSWPVAQPICAPDKPRRGGK